MQFFEVFDHLQVEPELVDRYEDTEVLKVAASRKSAAVIVYISGKRPIEHRYIRRMESQLQKQLFSEMGNTVSLSASYQLSGQYNPETLWNLYQNSILEEVQEIGALEYTVLKSAEISFEANVMYLDLKDTFINRHEAGHLIEYLENMYQQRYGYMVRVTPRYHTLPEEEKEEEPGYEFVRNDAVKQMAREQQTAGWGSVKKSASGANGSGGNAEGAGTGGGYGSGNGAAGPAGYAGGNSGAGNAAGTAGSNANSGTGGAQPNRQAGNGGAAGSGKSGGFGKDKFGEKKFQKKKLPDDPSVIYGRNFDGDPISISEIQDEIGEVVIRGKILSFEDRELRNGEKTLMIFAVTDFTDTILTKIFVKTEEAGELKGNLKPGKFVKLKGMALLDRYDHELSISSVVGIKTIGDFTVKRMDHSEVKRVELHAHTMMSDMDAVVDTKVLVKTAFKWGHKAIAITDHGVVQSFPDASHAINPKDYKDDEAEMKRAKEFKIIYGMEAYLVDDVKEIVVNDKGQSLDAPCVVFDIETTGFGPVKDQIIEIGAVKVVNGEITERYSTFIDPQIPIPAEIVKLTSITDEQVMGSPTIDAVLPEFLTFCEGCILIAHNASFDVGFITKKAELLDLPCDFTVVDTVGLARVLLPDLSNFKLNTVAKAVNVSLENHHRAVDDAGATAEIFVAFIKKLKELGIEELSGIKSLEKLSPEVIKKMPTYHAIMLCKNDTGRVNLYKMVSLSHIDYYNKRPRIPKSLFMENREGLLIGSACEAGELYQAILRNESQAEINKLAQFYDYLEIQPLGNNRFMIESDKVDVSSEEDLMDINRRIIELGDEFGKPVVATCDVHFLNPEDEVYRRIIMAGKGFKDADNQAPLYLRTTEEMLDEFMYLGREKAEEVVITNTNKIADMIEKISPVRPDKCPPVIENSDQTLRQICYDKAHSMYGPNLPPQVENRLEHELHSIITNGFAVMYIIAQKLVWKSNADGYLVGSRGSVGSSFVATMSGITEVNPLPAHYYCTNCYYSDFESEDVKQYAGSSGCDMPDKNCPVCGKPLSKDGHDIPFETFLGFNGDKEPDIDLNFSGEYQSKAHDYTEVIFGKGHTFRAGTIGTLAEKTAYGYVLKYNEEHGIHKRRAEVERISSGCVGVRRTTGQHPGGIVVLPHGEEIYSFTPVQRPANDMTTKTVTTHFDYHSIDHNLLKLDILGHDDPTMIRMLEDLTGIDAKTIRFDDEKVLSLFLNTSALGITPEDLDGCDLGSLGVPEMGTDFVMQMLRDTKPKNFSDLVRISGLSHGTDVWNGNAQTLVAEGKCTLSTAICTRDDIMIYLIGKGVEPGHAFKIMESVRKGKGLTPEMEEEMLANDVPDWYIWSCKRIQYMFPKAHAAAYVMMAFRIAYFKVYQPLAYYAAFFSIRATSFSYELMALGKDVLKRHMADYKRRSNELTQKEEATLKDMKIVQEMYARGFEFLPIDIYKVAAHKFQIMDGKLMPALSTIEGLGDKAADAVVEAAAEGLFLSLEDFRNRTKVSQTVIDLMVDLGVLAGLPKSNQISLMDFLV